MASTFNKYKEPCNLKIQVNLIKVLAHRLIFKNTTVYREDHLPVKMTLPVNKQLFLLCYL